MEPLSYPYRPKSWVMALCGLFFAACGVALFFAARDNDRGVLIDRLIELDAGQATILYWVLFACCIGFVAIAIFGVVQSFGPPREIAVSEQAVTVPAGRFSRESITIPFDTITDVRIQQVQSQKFLIIKHRGGKHSIVRSRLPNAAAFEDVVATIAARFAHKR